MTNLDGWLSLEETAEYLGMGKTALYALARDQRIPGRKIGKKWVFEKAGLDQWVRANRPVEAFFLDLDFKIDGNEYLRDPQRDGYLRTYEFFREGQEQSDSADSGRMREDRPRRAASAGPSGRPRDRNRAESHD